MALKKWFAVVGLQLAVLAVSNPSNAEISNVLCQQVRDTAKASSSPWVGLDRKDAPVAVKIGSAYEKGALDRIVFLHSRIDQSASPTVIAVKITFVTSGNYLDKNWVRSKNNFKADSIPTSFDDYQAYHDGTKDIFQLKINFHFSAGGFNKKIPFDTFDPLERRRQLQYPKQDTTKETTYRTYLLIVSQVAKDGSCIDFKPYFPQFTKALSVETVDLLPDDESKDYYRSSISADLKQ